MATDPCPRKCDQCAGSDHHWLEAEDEDGEPGDMILACKHCFATKAYVRGIGHHDVED